MDFLELLRTMDKEKLQKSIMEAKAYLATEEGKKTAEMLTQGKMPDGNNIPDSLKQAAESVKNNPAAQNLLKGYMDKNG